MKSGEETSLAIRMAPLLALLFLLLLAPPARAITCQQWGRLGPDQQAATIDRMIQSAIAGSRGRSYRVNRGAIGRCLASQAQSIAYDFDDVCSDPSTAGMRALDNTFKNYIWSCVG